MKKLLILTLSLALLFSSSSTLLAFGGSSCEVPKILKEGSNFRVEPSYITNQGIKILEIDKKSCWMKVQSLKKYSNGYIEQYWVNIRNLYDIKQKK